MFVIFVLIILLALSLVIKDYLRPYSTKWLFMGNVTFWICFLLVGAMFSEIIF